MAYDAVQLAGSLLILVAFLGALTGRLTQSGYRYLLANASGSVVLTVTAVLLVASGASSCWRECGPSSPSFRWCSKAIGKPDPTRRGPRQKRTGTSHGMVALT